MKTQVVIIGAGPAGLLLGQKLHSRGIETLILERRAPAHVLGRIRAGILQDNTRRRLREAGVGERMEREGLPHEGVKLAYDGTLYRVDFRQLAGSTVLVYGQSEITRDMMDARMASGAPVIYEAGNVEISGFHDRQAHVSFSSQTKNHSVTCDFVVGCDGFHGVSRSTVKDQVRAFARIYPFGWLGLLVDKPPVAPELIYCSSSRGFALCSQRSATRSRYYIQVPLTDRVEAWSDQAFYDELRRRIPEQEADALQMGKSLEKSITPLRSYVAEPLRFGNLFLAGDAAHLVPPTGAKGLNLAVSDVHFLSDALSEYYLEKSEAGLNAYSRKALAAIWRAEHFSWFMTMMMHRFPENSGFDQRMQRTDFAQLVASRAALQQFAENYTGAWL